jgi:hypothetical protein
MPNLLVAGNSTNGGTQITTDTSGTLNIVTGSGSGTTAIVVDTSQNVGFGIVPSSNPGTGLKVQVLGSVSAQSSGAASPISVGVYADNYTSTPSFSSGYIQYNGRTTAGNMTYNPSLVNANTVMFECINTSGLSFNMNGASPIAFAINGSERMRLDTSGGLILAGSTAQKATGTTWSNPSDQRLKNNIRDYTKGTTELMQVRVKEWEYNGKGGTIDGTKGIGVIADEIMTVLPNTVENYNAKLNSDDEETTEIKKFDATEITWLLVKTVQELKAELDAVKAKVGV